MSERDFSELRVLVVDGSRQFQQIFNAILVGLGVQERLLACTAAEGLRLAMQERPDLIIVDHDLRDGGGTAFVHALRRRNDKHLRRVPVIMTVSKATETAAKSARDAGVHYVLVKPVAASEVEKHIRACLSNPPAFIEVPEYCGPDRRRHDNPEYTGPERRQQSRDDDRDIYYL